MYIFAVALNDIIDIKKDSVLYPDRPLPSKLISLKAAVAICITCVFTAILILPVLKTLIIILLILLYSFITKEIPVICAINMGVIRAINLALASANIIPSELMIAPSIMHFTYVFMCTNISFIEEKPKISHIMTNLLISISIPIGLMLYQRQGIIWLSSAVMIMCIIATVMALLSHRKNRKISIVPLLISLLPVLNLLYLLLRPNY